MKVIASFLILQNVFLTLHFISYFVPNLNHTVSHVSNISTLKGIKGFRPATLFLGFCPKVYDNIYICLFFSRGH